MFSYPTGKEGAESLGYDADTIGSARSRLLESFCGVGNPFSLGEISPGEAVLDFGCGAGFDMFVASRLVGVNGRVCGVDLTREMVERARENLASAGVINYEVRNIDSGIIPYDDNSFDVVISNGFSFFSSMSSTSSTLPLILIWMRFSKFPLLKHISTCGFSVNCL
jgi:protein-L-isoaspartate O-methyltransferase